MKFDIQIFLATVVAVLIGLVAGKFAAMGLKKVGVPITAANPTTNGGSASG